MLRPEDLRPLLRSCAYQKRSGVRMLRALTARWGTQGRHARCFSVEVNAGGTDPSGDSAPAPATGPLAGIKVSECLPQRKAIVAIEKSEPTTPYCQYIYLQLDTIK